MPLYQIGVSELPTLKGVKRGEVERIIVEPSSYMADNEQAALIACAVKNSKKLEKLEANRLRVYVSLFR